MSNEVQRTFLIKLVVFSLGMGAVSHFFVGPKSTEAADLTTQLEMQTHTIARGEQDIQQQEVHVAHAKESMRVVTQQMLGDLLIDDALQSHQVIQRSAVSNGLTVTRVEPMQSTFSEVMTGNPQQRAKVEEKVFRIECQGSFAGVVAFVDELQNGPGRASVSSFRIIPSNDQAVSAVMSVKIVELIEVPEHLKEQGGESGASIQSPATQGDEQ